MTIRTIVTAFLLLVSCVIALAQGSSAEQAIRETRAQFNDAIARHDVDAIMAFLDDEYQITTSLGQMFHDRDEEARTWQSLFDSRQDVLYVRTPTTIEISKDYPLAAESGEWVGTWSTADGPVRTGGSYSAMWREVDGEWKVRSELFVALYCDGTQCP